MRASRARKPSRFSTVRSSGFGLDQRTGDAVADRAGLAARAAAVDADAEVVRALDSGDAERRHHLCAVRHAREVVLERSGR